MHFIDQYGLDRICGAGRTYGGDNPDGSAICVDNGKADEFPCFDADCKVYSPGTNSQCFEDCYSQDSKKCYVRYGNDPRRAAACISAVIFECGAKCDKKACEVSNDPNCGCD